MEKPKSSNQFLVLILFILSLCCCSGSPQGPVYIKDGKEYGKVQGSFRHKWWNYYERGLSFQEGKFHTDALSDLSEAIQQRKKDQRVNDPAGRGQAEKPLQKKHICNQRVEQTDEFIGKKGAGCGSGLNFEFFAGPVCSLIV